MRGHVYCDAMRARPLATSSPDRFASIVSIFVARSCGSRGRNVRPPSPITSRTAGISAPRTGVPAAHASKKTMPNADAYQMLAYCVALGLPRGYLVYAKDSLEPERRYDVVRHGYSIRVFSVDVELEPEDLLHQVDLIAAAIAQERVDEIADAA